MSKAMEVGRYTGTQEAVEKTAVLKHRGRDQGKTVGHQSTEGTACSARDVTLTLEVLQGATEGSRTRSLAAQRCLSCAETRCRARLPF